MKSRRVLWTLTLLTVLLIGRWALSHDEMNDPMTNHSNILVEPNQEKFLLVRWAIGSRDRVETLRIPLSYVNPITMAGCMSLEGHPTDSCTTSYAVELVLQCGLPDCHPAPGLARNDDRDHMEIFVNSIMHGNERTEREDQEIHARIQVSGLQMGIPQHDLRVIEKEGKFGLRRIGLDHHEPPQIASSFYEIYFDGESPESSPDFMVCMDESVPEKTEENHSQWVPICDQYFTAPNISAAVKVRYERQHLRDWIQIRDRVLSLLSSIKPESRR